jgi:hypothetical protein
LKLVAAALTGFAVGVQAEAWITRCASLSKNLADPYLRSIFALMSSKGDWQEVLKTEGLSFRDQIGIALRFLNDQKVLLECQIY